MTFDRAANRGTAFGKNNVVAESTVVSGELSYDRETANYYARNLTFKYTGQDGKEITDTVTGTIKWVEDPSRKENGKGRYEFNLRFNEEANQKGGDDAQFAGKNDDDLFFAVDNSIPSLIGNIESSRARARGMAELVGHARQGN